VLARRNFREMAQRLDDHEERRKCQHHSWHGAAVEGCSAVLIHQSRIIAAANEKTTTDRIWMRSGFHAGTHAGAKLVGGQGMGTVTQDPNKPGNSTTIR
jgi:hypothetical protein